MTNISKRKLPQTEFDAVYHQFTKIISGLTKQNVQVFFDDLLGPEEKVMLVKRLTAVVMYIEGNSSYRIWQLLKLSPSTADKIRLDYECGRYNNIIKIVTKNKAAYEDFWEMLDVLLQAGMPPQGRGRWKSVLKRLEKGS